MLLFRCFCPKTGSNAFFDAFFFKKNLVTLSGNEENEFESNSKHMQTNFDFRKFSAHSAPLKLEFFKNSIH